MPARWFSPQDQDRSSVCTAQNDGRLALTVKPLNAAIRTLLAI